MVNKNKKVFCKYCRKNLTNFLDVKYKHCRSCWEKELLHISKHIAIKPIQEKCEK